MRPRCERWGGGEVFADCILGGEIIICECTCFVQLNLFGDADQDWVRSKVIAYLDHGDVVSAVCNYMLENGFPKVNDTADTPQPKVCIYNQGQIQDFLKDGLPNLRTDRTSAPVGTEGVPTPNPGINPNFVGISNLLLNLDKRMIKLH